MNSLSFNSWAQIALYFVVIFAAVKPLGLYMAKVYEGEKTFLSPAFTWLERGLYKVCGIDLKEEMSWKTYAVHTMVFSTVTMLALYAILRLQTHLPLNPASEGEVSPDLSFNTAASFVTNTNWQSYGGESTMSYFSQMVGLTLQNFVSAAVGMAVLIAMTRGFVRKSAKTIGNFWVDTTRTIVHILLPLSIVFAVILASQGVVQTFKPYVEAQMMEKLHVDEQKDASGKVTQPAQDLTSQSIAVGPVASQVAIKQLGTNGGGFFNVNSAHPFENPTPLSNFLEMLAILLIPAALCYTFGYMVRDTRQGWVILIAMTVILLPLLVFGTVQEQNGNPRLASIVTASGATIDQSASAMQPGGNMEGKESRFGIANSTIWAAVTTAASNGSVNSMHDSYTPLGGAVPLLMIQFSEVIFGGVGSGLYGMLIYVLMTVFIAGLMVGRTPEYLGKKVQAYEIKMVSIAVLVPLVTTLIGTAIAVLTEAGKAGVENAGAQGFSEILYAFTSAGNNNGSAFAGLTANTPFYNIALGIAMLFSRFWCLLPVLAIAGSLAAKKATPQSAGTLPTHTPLFVALLAGVVVMVGVLTYIPADALGPVVEHFEMLKNIHS
jgi:K+-transporting ATPase ATPase A chain